MSIEGLGVKVSCSWPNRYLIVRKCEYIITVALTSTVKSVLDRFFNLFEWEVIDGVIKRFLVKL